MTGIIAEQMHKYPEKEKISTGEQRGCRKGISGTKDQLIIETGAGISWKAFGRCECNERNLSGRQLITVNACAVYDTPDVNVKEIEDFL